MPRITSEERRGSAVPTGQNLGRSHAVRVIQQPPQGIEPTREVVLGNFELFYPAVQIRLKEASRGWVNFNPRDEQADLLTALIDGDNTVVCKARQIGVSTAIMVYILWRFVRASFAGEPLGIMVIAHRAETASVLYRMVYNGWKRLPAGLKPNLNHHQVGYMEAAAGAFIRFETAGASGGPARGETIQIAWISEYAFCKDQDGVKSSIINAVPNERGVGQVIIESTPNHHGDGLHRELLQISARKARRTDSHETGNPLVPVFFSWIRHPEYSVDGPPLPADGLDDEEVRLMRMGATHGNIRFRRRQLSAGLSSSKFRRDYPITVEDAYTQGDNAFYREEAFRNIRVLDGGDDSPMLRGRAVVFENYQADDAYGLGADTATGAGRNFSVAYVVSRRTGNPVALLRSNTILPNDFAKDVVRLIQKYHVRCAIIEMNHSGAGVHQHVVDAGLEGRIWHNHEGRPWTTTQTNRNRIFDEAREHIGGGNCDALDSRLISELRSLTVDERERIIQPEDEYGAHCDSAVAFGLAVIACREVRLPADASSTLLGRHGSMATLSVADDGTLSVNVSMGNDTGTPSVFALDTRGVWTG